LLIAAEATTCHYGPSYKNKSAEFFNALHWPQRRKTFSPVCSMDFQSVVTPADQNWILPIKLIVGFTANKTLHGVTLARYRGCQNGSRNEISSSQICPTSVKAFNFGHRGFCFRLWLSQI
jgi:hypothetical protein